MRYRIVEQYKVFRIEKLVEEKKIIYTPLNVLRSLFLNKPTVTIVQKWISVKDPRGIFSKAFSSLKEAEDYLKSMKPIYHDVNINSQKQITPP